MWQQTAFSHLFKKLRNFALSLGVLLLQFVQIYIAGREKGQEPQCLLWIAEHFTVCLKGVCILVMCHHTSALLRCKGEKREKLISDWPFVLSDWYLLGVFHLDFHKP